MARPRPRSGPPHTGAPAAHGGPPALGRPLANTAVQVVNRDLSALPTGLTGEILISGGGVTVGYAGDAELTATRFITLPGAGGPRRTYRTGDQGWLAADGELHFAGRGDRQIKLAGRRIDLAEIEFAMTGHPGVRQAVATVTEQPDRPGTVLCGYVIAQPSGLDRDDLLRHLREQLPRHAVPVALVTLPTLPRTATGKVDVSALPAPSDGDALQRPTRYEPAGTATEAVVAEAFEQVLGAHPVGALDDFFDLGGTSLSALRLSRLLESLIGAEVLVSTIYGGTTVGGIARLIDAQ